MAKTLLDINNLINDRRRDSGSNSINMSVEGFRAINSTLDLWNQMHDWEFQIEKNIFNYNEGFTWYSVPTAFKSIVDIRNYRNPRTSEFEMVSASSFDSETLKQKRFSVATVGQTEYLRVKTSGDYAQLHTLRNITDGTWVGAGAISNLAADSYEYFDLSSSVSFNYSGTTGTVFIIFENGIDLSKFVNRSAIGFNTNFPTYTNWNSITLKLGSSATAYLSDYFTASVTTDYLGVAPTDSQWNKFKIDWSDLTKVGNPDVTDIDHAQFTVNYSSNPAISALRIENLFISENVPLMLEYYSTNLVVAASSSAKTQTFATASTTSDSPLWSGKYDWVNESFINSCLETVFFMTGEYTDMSVVQSKVAVIVDNLKKRIPSRRRYSSTSMKFEL